MNSFLVPLLLLFSSTAHSQVSSPTTNAISASGEMPLDIAVNLRLDSDNLKFSKGHAEAIEVLDLIFVEYFFNAIRNDVQEKAKKSDRLQLKQNAFRSEEQLARTYVTNIGFEILISGNENQDKIEIWNQIGKNSKLLGESDVKSETHVSLTAPWEVGTLLIKYRPHYNSKNRNVKIDFAKINCVVSLPGQKGHGTQLVSKTLGTESKSDSLRIQPKFTSAITKHFVKINRTSHSTKGNIDWYELIEVLQKDMAEQFDRDLFFENLKNPKVDMILKEPSLKNEFIDQLSEPWARY